MLRLIRARDGDRGAIAMIVAMLFGFGVMIGLAALTIDVGNISANRRVLQNGADAAVLSAVADCAVGACPAPTDASLASLVNMNAATGVTQAAKVSRVDNMLAVCGSDPMGKLDPCTALSSTPNLQECPQATIPPGSKGYVRVYTETSDKLGNTILPYSFGAAIAGVRGANQQTCAAAAWGSQGGGSVVPTAFSYCEWLSATHDGAVWPDKPPYTPPLPTTLTAFEVRILLSDSSVSGPPACTTKLGHDLPGGFGWVSSSKDCKATVSELSWMDVDTGTNVADNSCKTVIPSDLYKTIHIPVFDCLDPVGNFAMPPSLCPETKVTGTHAWYHVKGFAAFYLTGWKLNGLTDQAPLVSANACSGGQTCLYGWFFKDLVSIGEISKEHSDDLGFNVLQLLG